MRSPKRKLPIDETRSAPSSSVRPVPVMPAMSISVDAIADAALQARLGFTPDAPTTCDQCGATIDGEPAGRGLYLWSRGDELRIEEPALCSDCSMAIGVSALHAWSIEEDDEG